MTKSIIYKGRFSFETEEVRDTFESLTDPEMTELKKDLGRILGIVIKESKKNPNKVAYYFAYQRILERYFRTQLVMSLSGNKDLIEVHEMSELTLDEYLDCLLEIRQTK